MFFINTDLETESRYDIAKYFNFTSRGFEILNSAALTLINSLSPVGYITVTSQERKPDLLSYDIYGTTDYWWILMIYNGIYYTNDIISGMVIAYPSENSIANFYLNLNLLQKTESQR